MVITPRVHTSLYYNSGRGAREKESSGSAPGRPESSRAARRASGPLPDGPRRPLERSPTAPGPPDRSNTAPETRKRAEADPTGAPRRPKKAPETALEDPVDGAKMQKLYVFRRF